MKYPCSYCWQEAKANFISARAAPKAGAVFVLPAGLRSRTGPEAVEVFPRGRESSDLDVDRVGQLRARERVAFPDDISEPLVGGDLPLYRDPPVRHPTALQRVRGQACPEYDAVRQGVPRGDTEFERIGWEPWLSHSPLCERTSPEYKRRGARSAQLHEGSTVDLSHAGDRLDTPFSPVTLHTQVSLHSWPVPFSHESLAMAPRSVVSIG